MSSVIPSAKRSHLGSFPMLSNGKTAMDAFSDNGVDGTHHLQALKPASSTSKTAIMQAARNPKGVLRAWDATGPCEDADQLLTNGLLVGFAPATERNCRHVPTPRTLKGAGPCDVGCRLIRYHTTTNAARPAILGGLRQFQLTFASASWRWLGHHRCRREPPSRMSALGH